MISGTTFAPKPEIVTGKLRMLRDKILVKPLEWRPSELIDVVRHGRPVRGVVVAVGPGSYPNIYNRDKSKVRQSRHYRKTEVKPGDVVELGGLEAFSGMGYAFTEISYNGESHLICQEADVAAVHIAQVQ